MKKAEKLAKEVVPVTAGAIVSASLSGALDKVVAKHKPDLLAKKIYPYGKTLAIIAGGSALAFKSGKISKSRSKLIADFGKGIAVGQLSTLAYKMISGIRQRLNGLGDAQTYAPTEYRRVEPQQNIAETREPLPPLENSHTNFSHIELAEMLS
ncbi:hypothetical protein ElyMa_005204800 [Elysia marginata]|uniref:Senescence domain-containing protein n=1 Tax=Elysia marginata TaxID=1093978 RepID=A0AAV4JTP8_9GAST|nr:hypothetical protein ElyMa_005204800 [Elysia marginata]